MNYAHDKNRQTDDFGYVGQNFAWISSAHSILEKKVLGPMVEMWYNEVIKKDSVQTNHINNLSFLYNL